MFKGGAHNILSCAYGFVDGVGGEVTGASDGAGELAQCAVSGGCGKVDDEGFACDEVHDVDFAPPTHGPCKQWSDGY